MPALNATGNPIQVSTAVVQDRSNRDADIVALADGGYVVAWSAPFRSSLGPTAIRVDIDVRDANDQSVSAFSINAFQSSGGPYYVFGARLSAFETGGFIVAYQDENAPTGNTRVERVSYKAYDEDLNTVFSGSSVKNPGGLFVSAYTSGHDVAAFGDETAIVSYSAVGTVLSPTPHPGGGGFTEHVGAGPSVAFATGTEEIERFTTSLAVLSNDFAYVFSGGASDDIHAQIVSAAGELGPVFQVNSIDAGVQRITDKSVARFPGGNGFVVAWIDSSLSGDPANTDIRVRVFDASGNPLTGDILVNAETDGNQTNPAVAVRPDGSFVVSWDGAHGNTTGVMAQVFDAAGNKIGPQSFIESEASDAGVAALTDGDVVFAYTKGTEVFVERFDVGPDVAVQASGTNGDDTLDGADAADTLQGLGGYDFLFGFAGADTLDGGDDRDTVAYWGSPSGVLINLAGGFGQFGDAEGDTLISIENVIGTPFDDELIGDGDVNALRGLGGADRIDGAAGDDALDGGDGDDFLVGRGGADSLTGGLGRDKTTYASSTSAVRVDLGAAVSRFGEAEGDTLNGIEVIIGTQFNDELFGDDQGNEFEGLAGNDQMNGGGGADTLDGGAGDDQLSGGDGEDFFIGGAGGDQMQGGAGRDRASYATSAAVRIDLDLGTGRFGEAEGDTFGSIEGLIGSAFDDELFGDIDDNLLFGFDGNDDLIGQGGHDLLEGGNGNDRIWGGDGIDTLLGGAGADQLQGGGGYDTVAYYNSSAVNINLAAGTGSGGEAEGDTFGSIEEVIGSLQHDTLTGDNDLNRLQGLAGNDTLDGRERNDIIDGGLGQDQLHGGTDSDRFVYSSVNDSTRLNPDSILDFNGVEGDRIDLRAIDANTSATGDQAFSFIGTGAFTGVAGQLHYVNGNLLEGDVNGDTIGDFRIVLNAASMQAGDFLL